MNFSGPYDKQIAEQYQTARITPLWSGWEFGHASILGSAGLTGWAALAKTQEWLLPVSLRDELKSGLWAVVVTGTDQTIQYVNNRFEQMTGYSREEAVGRRPDFLQGAGTCQLTRQRIKEGLQQQTRVSEKLLNYRKDQRTYWCQVTIWPIMNRQKQVVNFVALEQEIEPHGLR
ncbi:hypothetical protein GCM10027341_20280 [Spirosoma knui]